MYSVPRATPRSAEHTFMEHLLRDLRGHGQAWAFQKPVNGDEVPDYYDVIKHPMGKHMLKLSARFVS